MAEPPGHYTHMHFFFEDEEAEVARIQFNHNREHGIVGKPALAQEDEKFTASIDLFEMVMRAQIREGGVSGVVAETQLRRHALQKEGHRFRRDQPNNSFSMPTPAGCADVELYDELTSNSTELNHAHASVFGSAHDGRWQQVRNAFRRGAFNWIKENALEYNLELPPLDAAEARDVATRSAMRAYKQFLRTPQPGPQQQPAGAEASGQQMGVSQLQSVAQPMPPAQATSSSVSQEAVSLQPALPERSPPVAAALSARPEMGAEANEMLGAAVAGGASLPPCSDQEPAQRPSGEESTEQASGAALHRRSLLDSCRLLFGASEPSEPSEPSDSNATRFQPMSWTARLSALVAPTVEGEGDEDATEDANEPQPPREAADGMRVSAPAPPPPPLEPARSSTLASAPAAENAPAPTSAHASTHESPPASAPASALASAPALAPVVATASRVATDLGTTEIGTGSVKAPSEVALPLAAPALASVPAPASAPAPATASTPPPSSRRWRRSEQERKHNERRADSGVPSRRSSFGGLSARLSMGFGSSTNSRDHGVSKAVPEAVVV